MESSWCPPRRTPNQMIGGWDKRLYINPSKSLNTLAVLPFYEFMKRTLLSLIAAGSMALTGVAFAASPSTYQVTGPVMAVDDTMITVMKGKEKFEVARDANTKVTGDLKVGDKVTIQYTMTAKEVEVKSAAKTDKADKSKKDDKTSASPSPAKK